MDWKKNEEKYLRYHVLLTWWGRFLTIMLSSISSLMLWLLLGAKKDLSLITMWCWEVEDLDWWANVDKALNLLLFWLAIFGTFKEGWLGVFFLLVTSNQSPCSWWLVSLIVMIFSFSVGISLIIGSIYGSTV